MIPLCELNHKTFKEVDGHLQLQPWLKKPVHYEHSLITLMLNDGVSDEDTKAAKEYLEHTKQCAATRFPCDPSLMEKDSYVYRRDFHVVHRRDSSKCKRKYGPCVLPLDCESDCVELVAIPLAAPTQERESQAEAFYQWLKSRFDINIADASLIAQFIHDIKNEQLEALPTPAPKEKEAWISVSDRLPKEGGRYWCYVKELNDLGWSFFQWNCFFDKEEGRFRDSTLTNGENVTHWMKLPNAPLNP